MVQVDNQGFLDMNIYAVRSSQRLRLGTAAGNSKTNLTIRRSHRGIAGIGEYGDYCGAERYCRADDSTGLV